MRDREGIRNGKDEIGKGALGGILIDQGTDTGILSRIILVVTILCIPSGRAKEVEHDVFDGAGVFKNKTAGTQLLVDDLRFDEDRPGILHRNVEDDIGKRTGIGLEKVADIIGDCKRDGLALEVDGAFKIDIFADVIIYRGKVKILLDQEVAKR